jgi:hypothetical protein
MTLAPLFGQGMTLVGSGYTSPTPIRVSPGQITTLFVSGLSLGTAKPQKATSLPLPNSLAGVSVTINQSSPKQSFPAPLLAVQQLSGCSNGGESPLPTVPSDCLVAAITVQIPFELSLASSNVGDAAGPAAAEVVITANGVTSKAFTIVPVTDNLHVIETCDAFPPKQVDPSQVTGSLGCNAAVTHADGTLVTAAAPGKAGEVLVIYAFGLGQTTPAVKTGSATPTPAPVLDPASRLGSRTLELQYDFRPNAEPSRPFNILTGVISPTPPTGPVLLLAPVFVGLTPGQVGLYQINVQLPSAFPAAVLPCTTLSVCTGNLAFCPLPIQSNLTIDIGGVTSFDGAAICIQPGK